MDIDLITKQDFAVVSHRIAARIKATSFNSHSTQAKAMA
jgi:hypothetical protein